MKSRTAAYVAAATMLVLIAACGTSKGIAQNGGNNRSNDSGETAAVQFERIIQIANSGVRIPVAKVIRSSGGLSAFMRSLATGLASEHSLPAIDFSRDVVLAICIGERKSGGYSVSVRKIDSDSNVATVYVTVHTPAPGRMVTLALTEPCVLVRAPLANQKVRFVYENGNDEPDTYGLKTK